ncbi:hypothetical protein E0Z10_g3508 [Xylaria hypoxylon]|uniref:Uncharacterized protein n=1 Tax=Xylaria hypoxylon TaxID=37992 RepID=A0A4Z0YLZ1_9PEZI|nr:hypothetical protein E0Z10_g3508 [Xylaria hypoxylon]
MIRQPFNSAIGRTRPDLSRVTDGIAASLRAFSTAQQLAAPPQDPKSSGDNGNNSQPTGRQRAAAAFSDLLELNKGRPERSSSTSNSGFKKLDLRSESAPIAVPGAFSPGGPNIIRGGIRGGFRGRGGFMRGGAPSLGGRSSGAGAGGMMGPPRRGGGRGRGRADGGRGRGRGKRDRKDRGDEGGAVEVDWSPNVYAMRMAKEVGSLHQFNPSISKSDLAGWGPAVAITGSSTAKDETTIRQARILGSGQPFHPLNSLGPDDMWKQYTKGSGVFFPTEDAKKRSAEKMGLEAFPPVPKETKDAVLQSALLGTYRGPEYADLKDTLSAVRNYVRRDASWNSDAEQRVEEKVRSLLPGGKTGPAQAPGGARTIV